MVIATSLWWQQGYIMSHDSLLAHHTHCEKHQIELVDTCPVCKEPLLWVSDVFEGCSCWQIRWRELEGLSSQIPVYQKVASKLTGIERKTLCGLPPVNNKKHL